LGGGKVILVFFCSEATKIPVIQKIIKQNNTHKNTTMVPNQLEWSKNNKQKATTINVVNNNNDKIKQNKIINEKKAGN